MMRRFLLLFAALFGLSASPASAQLIGRCEIRSAPGFITYFNVFANGLVQQANNPANAGFARRDPSGINYLLMPSANPAVAAYFLAWNGVIIEQTWAGWGPVGGCNFAPPPPPPLATPGPSPTFGVSVPVPPDTPGAPTAWQQDLAALPTTIVDPSRPFGVPLIATQSEAQACLASNPDPASDAFQACLARSMLGQREKAVFDCARGSKDSALLASCAVGALGGNKERQIAAQFADCYSRSNDSFQAMSLCMVQKNGSFSEDQARLIRCLAEQSARGDVSMMGTAVCYGAGSLNLNPETQIIIQCAAATGGQPKLFAACAGGQLTAREMDKCVSGGIGGPNGCFGPNNDIVKYLRSGGLRLAEIYGPLNPLVKAWNDGVENIIGGAREQGVKMIATAANNAWREGRTGIDNVAREVSNVMPRITVGTPKIKIKRIKFTW